MNYVQPSPTAMLIAGAGQSCPSIQSAKTLATALQRDRVGLRYTLPRLLSTRNGVKPPRLLNKGGLAAPNPQ